MTKENLQFWTDPVQAQERLANSTILYGEQPFFVERVIPAKGKDHYLLSGVLYPEAKQMAIKLDDERLHKYRRLPPLGWSNCLFDRKALFLDRVPRRSRQHGLNGDNVSISSIAQNGSVSRGGVYFDDVIRDKGYFLSCIGDFPSLEETLQALKAHSSLAISKDFAVYRDRDGLRWLYRKVDRIGLFSGIETLLLFGKFSFLKEELHENTTITVKDIREF